MRLFYVIAFIAALYAFARVSKADYKEDIATANHYCDMVRSGAWPDFDATYDEQCRRIASAEQEE